MNVAIDKFTVWKEKWLYFEYYLKYIRIVLYVIQINIRTYDVSKNRAKVNDN